MLALAGPEPDVDRDDRAIGVAASSEVKASVDEFWFQANGTVVLASLPSTPTDCSQLEYRPERRAAVQLVVGAGIEAAEGDGGGCRARHGELERVSVRAAAAVEPVVVRAADQKVVVAAADQRSSAPAPP